VNLLDLPAGIHDNVPAEVYHQRVLGVVNTGALKVLHGKTPAHYRAWLEEEPDEESKALEFGRALHCAMLEPAVFDATYVKPVEHKHRRPTTAQRNAKKPSDSTLAAIAYWDKWNAENAGLVEISVKDKVMIQGMAASVMAHPLAGRLFRDGIAESTAVWNDPVQKLMCKARIDWRVPSRGVWVDLKSTEDASPAAFPRSIAKYGYHLQHAHYASAAAALDEELAAFMFVAVEKEPPYAVAVHVLDAEAESRGLELRNSAMEILSECLINDHWPAYAPRIYKSSLPVWAMRD
jgi:hypothetical protein